MREEKLEKLFRSVLTELGRFLVYRVKPFTHSLAHPPRGACVRPFPRKPGAKLFTGDVTSAAVTECLQITRPHEM